MVKIVKLNKNFQLKKIGYKNMESEFIKGFIKKTIQEGDVEKIKDLFNKGCFDLLKQNDFIDLWEDQEINILENLLIVNREQNFHIFDGYRFPGRFEYYISSNIRAKIINLFEKLEDNDMKTLVWLDYINYIKEKDFSLFSEKSVMKFIKNYYYIIINSEKYNSRISWHILKNFEAKVGKIISEPVKRLIRTTIESKDYNKIVLINVYGWLNFLTRQDLYDLLNDLQLALLKQIIISIEKKRYEYHGFGDQLDKEIFNYFQRILPPQEAIALQEIQNIVSEQLIFDCGYHEEIFHAYKVKKNHIVKLWLSYSKISKLPESIGNLKFLKELYLSHCNLTFLPESIGNLKLLKILDLTYCDLTSLPQSFKKLQNLEKLYIYNNYFTSMPESIRNIKSLKYLDIYDEDFPEIPHFRKK